MLKNFVIIKHMEGSGKFLFRVPKGVSLSAGDKIVCDTRCGNDQLGVCCCDSFLARPEVIMPLFGTSEKQMKFVTGKVEYEKFAIAQGDEEYDEKFGEDGQQDEWEQV